MNKDFVHLRVHSEYSLKDSTIRIFNKNKEDTNHLIASCKNSQQTAVALTDEVNLFATVNFYKASTANGIKPIIGVELWVKVEGRTVLIPCFAINREGYRQLCTLISMAWINPKEDGLPVISFDDLAQHCADLIVLCGGVEGLLAPLALRKDERLATELERWSKLFANRFYLEVQRIGQADEEEWIKRAVELSQSHQLPLVATNKACFLQEIDFHAHEARVSINRRTQLGSDELEGLYTPEQYLRSTDEMIELFADLPTAIENTVLIAQRCNVEGILGDVQMPDFEIEGDDLSTYFRELSHQGLKERLRLLNITDKEKVMIYEQRLNKEMDVIEEMKYIGYFLIVADFIRWAKENSIPVGPGRGSGAGSLVAYALKITDVDPIRFDLIFERFLNIERQSMPDFDIDFCVEGRDKVIDYVIEKYGASQVAQIITFGTLSARAVVRDVARILGFPYAVGDMISKLIPNQLEITIEQAFELSKEFKLAYSTDEEVREVVDLSLQLEGLVRNVGKHAGGIVIAPSHIENFCPIYRHSDEDSSKVTQFHKDALEDIGLVKFDFLGLKNLTTIDYALEWINSPTLKSASKRQKDFSLEDIDYTDLNVYKTLTEGSVTGVFQFESSGIKRYMMRLKPEELNHLIDMVALYRPGPLNSGMADKYMDCRNGKEREPLLDEALAPILDDTNGVIIYQEQVMKIAQLLGGFSLGNADVLRQAMGKKNKEKMAQAKVDFLEGTKHNNISPHVADEIFQQMEKFAEYGFNKSHSVAYAVISYQTAYLKYHFPVAYMAALMSSDSSSQERLYDLKKHCEYLGIKIQGIDINLSEHRFVPMNSKEICWSLAAIKGVGKLIAEQITLERKANGAYKDFFDFCKRLASVGLSKRVLERLIYSGAFDRLHEDRQQLLENIDRGISYSQEIKRDEEIGQGDLFASLSTTTTSNAPSFLASTNSIPLLQLLKVEKQITGIYLNLNPYAIFFQEVQHYNVHSIKQFMQFKEHKKYDGQKTSYAILGETERLRINRKIAKDKKSEKKEKPNQEASNGKGEEKLTVTMEILIGDGAHGIECVIRNEQLRDKMHYNKWFAKQLLLIFVGHIKYDEITQTNSMEVSNVLSIHELRSRLLEKVTFNTTKKGFPLIQEKLNMLLEEHPFKATAEMADTTELTEQDEAVVAQVEVNFQEEEGELTYISGKNIKLDDDKLANLFAHNDGSVRVCRREHVDPSKEEIDTNT